ncbi:hypothetical protein [Pseudoduganella albidiflava]|uniref:DUF3995 domain-containing protein n=1 Tax=Pseudoduganella albidiflava TaxID=321983 RepID=A0A411WTB6_9BURK|nr:hypothetical protein [Pseudoduganella albidiflava]QBI00020.1 hypothetical protein EYF70_03530 [Pseudoduganella albidiflava]GGY55618.1 hypothetical protein GCM10007387_42710 [Pseudoduganella albidiflava]
MRPHPNHLLSLAAALSALAALLHLACIYFGAPWYRALGAGEEMARMAEAGSSYPAIVTLCIAGILFLWALYALSGAGVIGRLPLLRTALAAITAVYLLRGFGGVFVMSDAPGRSANFWLWSSAICAVFGIVHAAGLWQSWARLAPQRR